MRLRRKVRVLIVSFIIFKNVNIFVGLLHQILFTCHLFDSIRIAVQLVETFGVLFVVRPVFFYLFFQLADFAFVSQTAEQAVLVQKTNDNSKCNDGDKILAPAYETPDSDQFIHNFSFLYPQR
ncbi:conserved hypothetical protein [Bacteroides thetaiotaomicron VPI-5482]|uniref:Uncharacterized protein n=1 Tax=Bacteroides thetaiotaomicron (strain ATCC 29148 / DSM 2079 / JCM 5827 / CCUG 10774 / NCTC 10582 / VPI-5482 / E50) TaxID=226186 RepID=Q8A7B4_BACTN|nr:conserved hypothetical protein [Bacteroides thetaiotaomicron VPI-5482]